MFDERRDPAANAARRAARLLLQRSQKHRPEVTGRRPDPPADRRYLASVDITRVKSLVSFIP